MRLLGRVVVWHDDRGFGFIEPESDGERVFLHIGEFRGSQRPSVGTRVDFRAIRSAKGLRAVDVRALRGEGVSGQGASLRWTRSLVAFGMFALLWVAWSAHMLPSFVMAFYLAMSAILFVLYGWDKRAAQRGGQRTPEVTLQVMALSGGWPGALLAQQVFRHKSVKRRFQTVFWACVMLNVVGLWLFFSPQGIAMVRQMLTLILQGR